MMRLCYSTAFLSLSAISSCHWVWWVIWGLHT